MSEYGVGDHDMRCVAPRRKGLDRAHQPGDVVAVYLDHIPAERTPSLGERIEGQHVPRITQGLLPIQVDDRNQVRQAPVRRLHHRFPERALIALRVAEQDEDAAG